MKALMFAGGKGTRLLPETATVPKPLLRVGDVPIMDLLLQQLCAQGIREVYVAVGYRAKMIQDHFQTGERRGMALHYLIENDPLGTAGAIAGALPRLGENFLALNGDLLTTMNFSALIDFHRNLNADVTVAICPREVRSEFGIIEHDAEGRLLDYREKAVQTSSISMGCYVFRREAVAKVVRVEERLDMPDLILRLRDAGANIRCAKQECAWFDIGRAEDYRLASEWFSSTRAKLSSGG